MAFYTVIPVMLAWGAFQFADRMKNWERGTPAPSRRTTAKNAKRRFADFRAGVYMQTLLRDSGRRPHALDDLLRLPRAARRHHGARDRPPGAARTSSSCRAARTRPTRSSVTPPALVFVGGIVWAIVRRYVQRPYRIRIKTKPEHALILGTFLVIGVSGFAAEMFRIALQTAAGEDMSCEKYSFIGYPLSTLVDGCVGRRTLEDWHRGRGSPTSSRSSSSWRSCRSRCCATCSRRRSTCTCATRTARRAR